MLNNLLFILQQSQLFTIVIVAALGLCVGSFLNVVIYRTPVIMQREWRKESAQFWQEAPDLEQPHKDALKKAVAQDVPISLSFPPSRCPKCHHAIRFYENIPVVSWLFLKGKCSGCHTPISARYPLVELITAVLSVLVIIILGSTIQGVLALVFTWLLVALTGIDFDTQFLPDRLVYPLGMIGLSANAFGVYTTPSSAILGGVCGFLFFYVIAKIYAILKKMEGMGFGDFKLLAAIGMWVGVSLVPMIVLLSAVLGLIIGGLMVGFSRHKHFAFGPYIAIAGYIALLFGEPILKWYLG